MIKHLEPLFAQNIAHRIATGAYGEIRKGVFAAADVSIADTAVFKTKDGPVVLETGAEVADFTYLVGPVYVGARSRIIERASLKEHVCIGQTCKVGGEVEASISLIRFYLRRGHPGAQVF